MNGQDQNNGSSRQDRRSEDEYGVSWGRELPSVQEEEAAEAGMAMERKFYSSFYLDGLEYCLKETVYLRAEDGPPYIARILNLYENVKLKKKQMRVRWFCRPCELPEGLPDVDYGDSCKEVFLMTGAGAENINHPATTIGRCTVLCTAEEEWNANFPSIEMIATADHIFDRAFDAVNLRSLNASVKRFGQYLVTGVGEPKQKAVDNSGRDKIGKARSMLATGPSKHSGHKLDEARLSHLKALGEGAVSPVSHQAKRSYAKMSGEDGPSELQKKPREGCSKTFWSPQGREGDAEKRGGRSSKVRKRPREDLDPGTDRPNFKGPKLNTTCHVLPEDGETNTSREKSSELFAKSPRVSEETSEKNSKRNSPGNDSTRVKSPRSDLLQSVRDGKNSFSASCPVAGRQITKTSSGHNLKADSQKERGLVVDRDHVSVGHRDLDCHITRADRDAVRGPEGQGQLSKRADVDSSEKLSSAKKTSASIHLKGPKEGHLPSNSNKITLQREIERNINGESGRQLIGRSKSAVGNERSGRRLGDAADRGVDSAGNSLRQSHRSDNRSPKWKHRDSDARPNARQDIPEPGELKVRKGSQHADEPPISSRRHADLRTPARLGSPDCADGRVKSPKADSGLFGHERHDSISAPSEDYRRLFEPRKKIFNIPWKDSLRKALEQRKALLLQNLDPWFSSFEIEAMLQDLLQVSCDARMLPPRNFASYTSGQALVLFRTRDAAAGAFTKFTENWLIWSKDRRPVLASWAEQKTAKYNIRGFFNPEKFGNMSSSAAKMDTGLTSHCSQPNTVEYEMGIEWRLLQKRHTLAWQRAAQDVEIAADHGASRREQRNLIGNLYPAFVL